MKAPKGAFLTRDGIKSNIGDGMQKLLPLGYVRNRTELDRVLLAHNARLMDNREIPTDQFHRLTHTDAGIVVLFIPKVTQIDKTTGAVKKGPDGNADLIYGRPVASVFRHSICSPIHLIASENNEKGTFIAAPALVWVD